MTADTFKTTVCVHLDAMYRVALALCGNGADAADAVQNAAINLWEKRRRLDGVANMQPYCVGAARNAALTLIARRHPADSIDTAPPPPDYTTPESRLENADAANLVVALMDTLPARQRTVLAMRDVEGLEMNEIEKLTGLTAQNIRVLLCRARATIRKHFTK